MSDFYTMNLRNDVRFETPLFPSIYWVPVRTFTENTKEHIYKIIDDSEWEIHKSGFEALRDNSGSCASILLFH